MLCPWMGKNPPIIIQTGTLIKVSFTIGFTKPFQYVKCFKDLLANAT